MIEEEKDKILGMFTRIIFGIQTGSLKGAEEDILLWKTFINLLKRELKK